MKACYFCGEKMTSKEHIPPQQIFSGFRINRITVYSCNKHNSQKGYKDEAIVKAMLMAIENSFNINITPELEIALEEVKTHYDQVKKLVTKEQIIVDSKEKIICLDKSVDLDNWIKQLSAGMIYYKIKKFNNENKFIESKVFERNSFSKNLKTFEDFQTERNRKIKLQNLSDIGEWQKSWLPENYYPKNLYFFEYKFISNCILIKHVFYKCFVFNNLIEISNNTKELIIKNRTAPNRSVYASPLKRLGVPQG